jgi:hypothetical protein
MERDTDTKQHLLEMANNFFMDFGIHFTIKPLANHHVYTNDKVYTLQSNKCYIYLAVCPGEYIYIDNIEKCGSHSGSEVLERIKSFGKFLGVKYIKLYDAAGVSSNTCDFIAFAPFSLYTKGKTWYQLHGFNYVSDPNGEIDYSGSKTIPFHYFLDRRNMLEFQRLFPDIYTTDKTIGQVMKDLQKKYLHRDFTHSLSKEQCKVLSSITIDLYQRVLPDESMIYVIPYDASSSRSRSRSKSTSKSKSK